MSTSAFTLPPVAWQLTRLSSADEIPGENNWFPATVPGAVQLDWARAHKLPPLNYGQNLRAYEGLEDYFWLYRTRVPAALRNEGQRLFLRSAGLDYHAEIRVDGELRLIHTGLATPFEIDLSSTREGAAIEILLHPAPKRADAPPSRSQADQVTKPAVSYGWDWHPRLIPLGLCEDLLFEVRPAAHLRSVDFAYTLADDFSSVDITVTIETSAPATAHWNLRDPDGVLVLSSTSPHATLKHPLLWWTHDQGTPALYTLEVALDSGDCLSRAVGFRRVRLVMHPGAWENPSKFPKSRSHPPITVELNGRPLFAKGSNWLNPEIFHGKITADTYRPLLLLARDAHFNLLRCWGGAPVAKEAFFEQCDALGLLIWQEFPLACNLYPDTPAYLALLDQESRSIIRRLRQHPSLALWCGGNELFNAWSGMTDQSLPLRLLNRNCYDLDPSTPFIPTAPLDGMGHGDYVFLDDGGRDIFQIFQSASNTGYSEFVCSGPSPVEYLKTFIPPSELWPPCRGTSWELHHTFNGGAHEPVSWNRLYAIEQLFGPPSSLEELVACGEWLQSEGFKSVFEEARRQSPRCAMALSWCYNEPWPAAASSSIINWPAYPKAAYFAVQAACRPTLASARIPRFQWRAGEQFSAEIWLLHDGPADRPAGELRAELHCGLEHQVLLRWEFPASAANTNLAGPSVRVRLPSLPAALEFSLKIIVLGKEDWSSSYRLQLLPDSRGTQPATPTLNA